MSQLSPKPIEIDGSGFRFGIVAARFNQEFVDGLADGAREVLIAAGVLEDSIVFERVPGSNELPLAAKLMAETGNFDGILALGAIIKGGTRHYEMVADGSNYGLHRVALDTGVPIVNGVIVGDTEEDVKERCIGSIPKGKEFGECALEMATLRRKYL
ncbi:6,7-dimethyl-8-ribityllumazine synthase [Puniceicoccaceae bacterium K14]|nr:6,7-dimethyl-8-ribityllumazine synthase [Puniceicoccaceae bacterium K14]